MPLAQREGSGRGSLEPGREQCYAARRSAEPDNEKGADPAGDASPLPLVKGADPVGDSNPCHPPSDVQGDSQSDSQTSERE